MWRLAKGGLGVRGANRANRANPPPSDPSPARQVTLQVAFEAKRGAVGGDPVLREWGSASRPCDWPRLAMLPGTASL